MPESGSANTIQLAAARAHFLQVRLQLLEQRVVRRDRDTGMSASTSASGPCLSSPAGIGLGVDVGDFLELERAFHRDRVVHAAAEEQRVLLVGESLAPSFSICGSSASASSTCAAGVDSSLHEPALALRRRAPVELRQRQREQASAASCVVNALVEATPISGPARVSSTQLGLAHQRAFRHVADRERRQIAERFAMRSAASVSAVSPDCEMVTNSVFGSARRLAVAIFARDLHAARQAARSASMQYRATEPGVIAGAARDDLHGFGTRAAVRRASAPNSCGEQRAAGDALFERVARSRAAARRSP